MISAQMILDSISPQGHRLMSVKAIYPWFVHGEVMTHREFSRNASSNRAIPVAKLIAEARSDQHRAMPSFSVVKAAGMQGGRETTEEERRMLADHWRVAALYACDLAEKMDKLGGAKQDVNRLLMPFTHARVLISSTEWLNFFGLRLDASAQPEARMLAEAIWDARKTSIPGMLNPGEWHLPYIQAHEWQNHAEGDWPIERLIKVSVARCARVSYESFDTGKLSTMEEDLILYGRLVGSHPMHASPAEHQATPDVIDGVSLVWRGAGTINTSPNGVSAHVLNGDFDLAPAWKNEDQHGNFTGWRQYRKMLAGESCAPLPPGYVW